MIDDTTVIMKAVKDDEYRRLLEERGELQEKNASLLQKNIDLRDDLQILQFKYDIMRERWKAAKVLMKLHGIDYKGKLGCVDREEVL